MKMWLLLPMIVGARLQAIGPADITMISVLSAGLPTHQTQQFSGEEADVGVEAAGDISVTGESADGTDSEHSIPSSSLNDDSNVNSNSSSSSSSSATSGESDASGLSAGATGVGVAAENDPLRAEYFVSRRDQPWKPGVTTTVLQVGFHLSLSLIRSCLQWHAHVNMHLQTC